MKYDFILAAYVALAGVSLPASTSADPSSQNKGLEARLENVQHGFWKGKYRADADLYLRNGGSDLPAGTLTYSLCFEGPNEEGKIVSNCVAGKNEFLSQGLSKGKEIHFRVNLQQKFAAAGNLQKKKPKIGVSLFKQIGEEPLYSKNFFLGSSQEYQCAKSCPD